MSSIGKRIKELLNKHDISQKDLARYIGTTEASISRYVNDEREPVAKILYKIAQELHTTTDYLISGTGDDYEELYWIELDRANSYARKLEHTKQFNEYYKNQNKVLEKMIEYCYVIQRDDGLYAKYDWFTKCWLWEKFIPYATMFSEKFSAEYHIEKINLQNCKPIRVKFKVV